MRQHLQQSLQLMGAITTVIGYDLDDLIPLLQLLEFHTLHCLLVFPRGVIYIIRNRVIAPVA